jgi:hypothetical protein
LSKIADWFNYSQTSGNNFGNQGYLTIFTAGPKPVYFKVHWKVCLKGLLPFKFISTNSIGDASVGVLLTNVSTYPGSGINLLCKGGTATTYAQVNVV